MVSASTKKPNVLEDIAYFLLVILVSFENTYLEHVILKLLSQVLDYLFESFEIVHSLRNFVLGYHELLQSHPHFLQGRVS